VDEPSRNARVVVVSPHLDDGVLSLGASMAAWARRGARVELLTVLAGDPESEAPAGGWDSRAGFATEGEASRVRRAEDSRACAALAVAPLRLDFGYQDYERHGDDESVRAALAGAIADADVLVLPGAPLSHPDHEWLVRIAQAVRAGRVGFYVEQPYGSRSRDGAPAWLERELGSSLVFADASTSLRDRLTKWRALRAYASQLPLLALTGRRALALALRPERIAWVDGTGH
jgi:LmbE family N-acetylglucosaminyl deacetylase